MSTLKTQFGLPLNRDAAQTADHHHPKFLITRRPPLDRPQENCIAKAKVSIKEIKLQGLKSEKTMKIIAVSIKDLLLRKQSYLNTSNVKLKGQLSIEYFNKRNMQYEPFLEPWIFIVRYKREDNNQHYQLSNYQQATSEDTLPQIIEHQNSLNINVTTSFIETLMEGYHLWKEKINESDPYEINNELGYPIKIQDSRSDLVYVENLDRQVSFPGDNQKLKDIFNHPGEVLVNITIQRKEFVNESRHQVPLIFGGGG